MEGKRFDKFDEILSKIKFLTADVKARLQNIGDEYKTKLGVKEAALGRKLTKKGTMAFGAMPLKKMGTGIQRTKTGAVSTDAGKGVVTGRGSELLPVEEEVE